MATAIVLKVHTHMPSLSTLRAGPLHRTVAISFKTLSLPHLRSPLLTVTRSYHHIDKLAPTWLKTMVASSKAEAKEEEDWWVKNSDYRAYSDGSMLGNGGVGAAAVLYTPGRTDYEIMKCYLGLSPHTTNEAEIIDIILAVELLKKLQKDGGVGRMSIAVDNTSCILATREHLTSTKYLMCCLRLQLEQLHDQHHKIGLTIRWVPGHRGIVGNECADLAAKEAARGQSMNIPECLLNMLMRSPHVSLCVSSFILGLKLMLHFRGNGALHSTPMLRML